MGCTYTNPMDEITFVQGLTRRDLGECHGPAVTLQFAGYSLHALETAIEESDVLTVLWDAFLPDHPGDRVAFRLCAIHWLDLCAYILVRGRRHRRPDWLAISAALLKDTCRSADWDPKELSNLFGWRRVSLT